MKTHCRYGTPIYRIWASMLTRCRNPKQQNYHLYGGRGITVCRRWEKFECFLLDMGEKPKGMTLDRIDNSGNYEPKNCRWTSLKTQARNKRNNRWITAFDETKTLAEWAEVTGINATTIAQRIDVYGWQVERALLIKRRQRKKSGIPVELSSLGLLHKAS